MKAETPTGYELRYLARKFGLTTAQAVQVKREANGDRAKERDLAWRLARG